MASKLNQLKCKAGQASQFVAKHGTAYYRQLIDQNKQYIQEPPTVEKCNLLAKQLLYTRLARLVHFVIAFFSSTVKAYKIEKISFPVCIFLNACIGKL